MKLLSRSLLLAALPLLLSACASAGGASSAAPASFTLQPTQHVAVGPNATLTYDSYSDSRCPKGAYCIWAGELVYRFTLAAGTVTESFALGPHKPVYISQALRGAHIALDTSALPQVGAAPQSYPVTLTVSQP